MTNYKTGKWASRIIASQNEDGSWGCFHSQAVSKTNYPMTTEQALRRLHRLGFTKDDKVIQSALSYMNDCLAGKKETPDRVEKGVDWEIFTKLMLAAWIRRFTPGNALANEVANKWRSIAEAAFESGVFSHKVYDKAWRDILKPKYGRIISLDSYYPVLLLSGEVDESIEKAYYDYIFTSEKGFYYGYTGALTRLPDKFQSKQASRFLTVIELLAGHPNEYCKKKLKFIVDWLKENRNADGKWDMGADVRDGAHFPLSDSWRTPELRETDCTYRIQNLLIAIDVCIKN